MLVGLGLRGLWALRGPRATPVVTGSQRQRSAGRTYLSLLGLTLLNPMTVIYFVALTVGLPFLGGLLERLAFALAALVASLSWQSLLAIVGVVLGRGSGHRLRRPTVVLGNVLIVLMGGLIMLEGLRA